MKHVAFNVRFANEADLKSILSIYTPFVRDTSVSFETEVPSLVDFCARFTEIRKMYPWLVCEMGNEIAGYAYASPHRSRDAYSWSVDVTVYVAPKHQRKGVGRSLYLQLFAILREQGFCNAYAGIALPNAGSVALHESLGFSKVGIYKNVGYKFSQWHGVAWYQLELKSTSVPKKPIPFTELIQRKGVPNEAQPI